MLARIESLIRFILLTTVWLTACTPPVSQATNPTASSPPSLTLSIPITSTQNVSATIIPFAYLAPHSSVTPVPYLGPLVTRAPYPGPLTGKPIPFPSPTPVIHWNRQVIEVSWKVNSAFIDPGWVSDTIANLANYPESSGGGSILVDISAGTEAKPARAPIIPGWMSFSPSKTYVIECRDGMRMVRVKDNKLISETSLLTPFFNWGGYCSEYIRWAPNESIASFLASDNNLYVWRNNGTEPRKIMDNASSVFPKWSPDAQKFVILNLTPDASLGTVTVIDNNGQLLNKFQIKTGAEYSGVGWFTNTVLASYSRYTTWYYDIQSGLLLFSWTSAPNANGIFHQFPQASPDGRWIFIDQGDKLYKSSSDPYHLIVQKEYSLYNVRDKIRTLLLDQKGTYLKFAGWNSDSSKMYVVSRPAESTSVSDPSMPFGLLAYDVNTRQFKLVFKDAIQVSWNADKSWAYIVFAARNEKGKLGFVGVLWNVDSQTMIGRWHNSSQMIYRDPETDSFLNAHPGPYSIRWSHDGRKVAVCDEFGQVKVANIDGEEFILTSDMNVREIGMSWSPDDQHLLVEQENRAWIVSMSGP